MHVWRSGVGVSDRRRWFKVDVGYLDNPKISELVEDHPRAIILHLTCIAYAKQHGTDGRVPMRLAMRRACAEHSDASVCIDAGILSMDGDSHLLVHDYVRHQGSAHEDEEAAKTASQRASRAARARWDHAKRDAPKHARTHARSNASLMLESCGSDAEKRREEKNIRASADAADDAVNDVTADTFDEWWSEYPRKVGKGQAVKAYRAAVKKVGPSVLLDGLRSQRAQLASAGQYCPHPATWLNGERWADEQPAADPRIRTTGDGEQWDLGEWGR